MNWKIFFMTPEKKTRMLSRIFQIIRGKNQTAKKVILVVEDDEVSYLLLKEIISSLNVKETRAVSKEGAMRLVKAKNKFRVIVADIMLNGDDNGMEIARELHDMKVDIPVIIISAWAGQYMQPENNNPPNIKHIMLKPFKVNEFKRVLLDLLEIEKN